MTHGKWPNRRYVEHEMDRRGFALEEVLPTFPAVRGIGVGPMTPQYRAVWYDNLSGAPENEIGLTVAGLAQLPDANQFSAGVFLRLLSGMADYFLGGSVDPFTVKEMEVSLVDLAQHLRLSDGGWLPKMPEFFQHEPPTWGGQANSQTSETRWRYTRAMRHFAGVNDVPDYLDRLSAYLAPPTVENSVEPVDAPLGFVAGLDFLDTVWRLRYGLGLFRLPAAYPVATLMLDATSREEFDARLSALGQILKGMEVDTFPGVGNHPVPRLRAQLQRDLPPDSHALVGSALDALEAVSHVRNAGQHVRATPESVEALHTLRLTYPITDWLAGWRTIRARVSGAMEDIREEMLSVVRQTGVE